MPGRGSGAPFDVLLAADDATPHRLVAENRAIAETDKTYAIGKLVLWSSDPAFVDANGAVLKSDKFKHLSVADPKLAPYGLAAQEALQHLGIFDSLKPKLVVAGNIAQAYQFVSTGNAELGFVALGQVQQPDGSKPPGSMWLVPDNLYSPIRQNLVVPEFQNVHVYDFLCAVLGVTPAKNDGDPEVTRKFFKDPS